MNVIFPGTLDVALSVTWVLYTKVSELKLEVNGGCALVTVYVPVPRLSPESVLYRSLSPGVKSYVRVIEPALLGVKLQDVLHSEETNEVARFAQFDTTNPSS